MVAALLMREGGFLDRRITKIAPERIPKLLKRARARAEKMPEGSRKKWVLTKIKEWELKPPEEVLKNAILFVVVFAVLGLLAGILGAAIMTGP